MSARHAAALCLALALAGCGGPAPRAGAPSPAPTVAQIPLDEPDPDPEPSTAPSVAETPSDTPDQAPAETPTQAEPPAPVEVAVTTIATGLEAPWGLAFRSDGSALVSERDTGRVLAVASGSAPQEVASLEVDSAGEGGLLGLALAPGDDQDLYAYLTTPEDNRVVRLRPDGAQEPVLTGIPSGQIHNGGRIAFGPDGMLYVATGDSSDSGLAQDPDSLAGKILRLTPDGGVPPDNPVPGNPLYSLGHRNVQGLAWTADGDLLATEFGQNRFDEVNRIEPGGNYGWPEVEGSGGGGEFVEPLTTFTTAEASPSGAVVPDGSAIPQWDGDVLLAALRGARLWRLELDEAGAVAEREPLLVDQAGRLRHVAQAPDGSLWVLTSNRDGRGDPGPDDDRILRLGPSG